MLEIDKKEIKFIFYTTANFLMAHSRELNQLDSEFGDGDYGTTISKICHTIKMNVDNWEDNRSIKKFIENLGDDIMGVSGGAAGPLWGTLFLGLSLPLFNETKLSVKIFKKMFKSSLDELSEITLAKVGDKTMMDSFIPAVESISLYEGERLDEMFTFASEAAIKGCNNTKLYAAKFGKAKKFGDKTIGFIDVSSYSISLLFQGFLKASSN
ncbi:dihydroxyacetone kinase subunit L [uncultured Cetobacterium sp.]|uniref:dihydroxyacetone kinase subunit L n=1 Tax=uncultured Cetobacterium sp. TaxID=527638 RepID=UPI0026242207|nr:dihydroxyacetone kinase subunit L [uncultured Cetobacterium sp.]